MGRQSMGCELSWVDITFEFSKLIVQLLGAVLIAWLTVGWALSRYKREKVWEYRFRAYTELVTTLGDMLDVLEDYEEMELGFEKANAPSSDDLKSRRITGRRRLAEVRAVSKLTLGREIGSVLDDLWRDLARHDSTQFQDWTTDIDEEHRLIREARDLVVELAKDDLQLDSR